jgi:hypothetical protein
LQIASRPRASVRLSIRRGLSILSMAWLVFLLAPLSGTGLAFFSFAAAFAVTLVTGAVSLSLVLTRTPVRRAVVLAWLAYPVAACALVALFLFSQSPANPLFRLRFLLSRPALDRAARLALSHEPPPTPSWIGLFPIRRIDAFAPEVRLISDGCGVIDACGLLYRPGPVSEGRPKTRLQHLEGPWYHLYSVF